MVFGLVFFFKGSVVFVFNLGISNVVTCITLCTQNEIRGTYLDADYNFDDFC